MQSQISNKAVASDITTGTDLTKILTSKSVFDATILPKKETIVSAGGALNNLATPTEILRFTNQTTPVIISGLVAPVGFKSVILFNDTLQAMNILHQSISSSAGNKLSNNNDQDLIIQKKGFAKYVYSDSLTAWVLSDLWASDYCPTMVGASKRAVSVTTDGYMAADDILEIKTYLDGQTTNLTTAQLNILYPDYQKGQEVICQNITAGAVIYQKVDDGTDEWVAMAVTKASVDPSGGRGLMTSTGVINKLLKYSSTSNAVPSQIDDDGSSVLVGTTSTPTGSKLQVGGDLSVDSTIQAKEFIYTEDALAADLGITWGNSVNIIGFDWRTVTTGGVYELAQGAALNSPSLVGNYAVIVEEISSNNITQKATHISSGRIFTCEYNGTSWSVWKEITRPYKVYSALLNQTTTSAPVATVLQNELGESITWTRSAAGLHNGNVTGNLFTSGKTMIFVTPSGQPETPIIVTPIRADNSNIALQVMFSNDIGAFTDGLTNLSIEIRVYL